MAANANQFRNYLLSRLEDRTLDAMGPHLGPIPLPRAMILATPSEHSEFVYFIEAGIASAIVVSPEGRRSETGVIGREGVTPISHVLADGKMPIEVVMQLDGEGYRLRGDVFASALQSSPDLRTLMLRYVQAFFIQCAFTSLSNAIHHVEERLARWLLMCHDRADGDRMALTHEFISVMLSVRRPSVTTALHVLEGKRLITSERNLVVIRDRAALEEFAKDAYGLSEGEYERLICTLRKSGPHP